MALSLTAYQNQRFRWSYAVTAEAVQHATLGSASWRMQVRAFPGSPVVIAEFVSGGSVQDANQIATYDATAKIVTFRAPTAAIARIPSGTYAFDFGFVLPGADFERVNGGTIEFDPGVTLAGVSGEPAPPASADDTVITSTVLADDAAAATAAAASALAAANSATAAANAAASIAASAVTSVMGLTGAVTGLEQLSHKGAVSGYAGLDGSSLVPVANIPNIASTKLSDATTAGRALLTAASAAAQKVLLAIASGDVSGLGVLATATPGTGVATAIAIALGAAGSVLTTSQAATLTAGFKVTPNNIGTISSGTVTPDAALGNYQYLTNNGAFTLAAPAADSAVDILLTNGASAGSITFSGFTVGASIGGTLTTTSTNKFIVSIRRINAVATYSIYALQ